MAWRLDKSNAKFNKPLTFAEQNKFDAFQNAVHNQGKHPRVAAEASGDMNYKKLRGTSDQYEIRLSQGCRATFTQNDAAQLCTIMQVGGHT